MVVYNPSLWYILKGDSSAKDIQKQWIAMPKLNVTFFKKLPDREKKITLSTIITLIRIVLTPVVVGAIFYEQWSAACGFFIAAALTDAIDGSLARWLNEKTFLGACIDPIADKILILSSLLALASIASPLKEFPVWLLGVLIVKELVVISGAIIIYRVKGYVHIKPTMLGKLTTVVQMFFIAWLLACYGIQYIPLAVYYNALSLILLLTIISLVQYVRIGLEQWSTREYL
jgi:cardiolipin synthase (CMP-forming)